MVGLTVPVLIQDGMFMDAMLYTSVAHNLSLGYGTFWFPQFSLHNVAGLAAFHEQPPLVFGIEALFFKLLGSSMYTERMYTFGTMLATAALMVQLWRESIGTVAHTTTTARIAWLPLLLWITIPTAFWSYSNNMQENTMGVFTLVAVGCGFRGLRTMFAERFWRGVAWVVVSGVFVFLATLSKGFPGFFPVMLPAVYLLTLAPESLRSVVASCRVAV